MTEPEKSSFRRSNVGAQSNRRDAFDHAGFEVENDGIGGAGCAWIVQAKLGLDFCGVVAEPRLRRAYSARRG
ncbi:hypothetical protein [Leisingera sp.]|uniref:hypothetical protein n=1 Tax=Leisingera sp. TaxID=1879318 RepID=UPI003A8FBA09